MGSISNEVLLGGQHNPHNKQKDEAPESILVDDLIRQRARENNEVPLVAYPKSEQGLTDYQTFTAKSIDHYITKAAEKLRENGYGCVHDIEHSGDEPPIIALLGPSNFDYLITMLALSRLGYAILILSPRLSIAAYESLLNETGCTSLIYSKQLDAVVHEIINRRPLTFFPIVPRSEYEEEITDPSSLLLRPGRPVNVSIGKKTAYIMHSSGSTGLPKCIYLSHASCLSNFANGHALKALLTVPLYHMHGHASLFRAIHQRKTCYMYNTSKPLTSSNLAATIEAIRPEVVLSVPYGLKLIAENKRGIEALKGCKIVSFAGSGCPDELGDYLTSQGIKLVSGFGATETGQLMNSDRPDGDTAWNYLRVIPPAKPYVWMKPIENGSYELVVLDGLKSKIASNSDEPPNSFHTRDMFVSHPSIPDAWKYLGRLDDRITLVNGEKVLPLPIEGRIRQEALVREAVVFGISRSVPGLLVFRADEAADLSDEDFIERIWPAVEDANSRAESFSQISKETIIPMPASSDYPRTDKGTIIRAQVYQMFDAEISEIYKDQEKNTGGTLKFDINDMQAWLLQIFTQRLGIHLPSAKANFFAAGFDSLQATRLLHVIKKELYLNGTSHELSTSALYGTQTVEGMAKFIHAIQTGSAQTHPETTQTSEMAAMVNKYSHFSPHIPTAISFEARSSVILTGATGSLGVWVLSKLLAFPSPPAVYCLVRANSTKDAHDRILKSLRTRGLTFSPSQTSHIAALPCDFSSPDLGLADGVLERLRGSTTHIIHLAWPVNFMLPLSAFEEHIAATHSLLQFSLSVSQPSPAKFIFASSISAAANAPSPIPETYTTDLSSAQNMGYARSKLVAEHVVHNAVERAGVNANAAILRVGQIVGDTVRGIWNETEAIPLMIRSSLVTGVLPALEEECAWLPVDVVAQGVLEVAGVAGVAGGAGDINGNRITNQSVESGAVYNFINPHTFSWTQGLLPALRNAGLRFGTVETQAWLQRLSQSERDAAESEHNKEPNPALKLLEFWKRKYAGAEISALGTTLETNGEEAKGNATTSQKKQGLTFETQKAETASQSLREVSGLMGQGYLEMVVARWLDKWAAEP